MSTASILTNDIILLELTDLFCRNQKLFYTYIAKYAASNSNENHTKPLRFHKIDNKIDCIFSPNMHWSFYNAILETDLHTTYNHKVHDRNIEQILSLASRYKCPMRIQVKPSAIDTQNQLKQYGFIEFPMSNDELQYMDFYDVNNSFQHGEVHSDIRIYELDDSKQVDCVQRKSEWGYVLCESFGLGNSAIYGPFYSDIWSRVEVGPTKPIRMFIAMKNDRVIGGCHVSLAAGIASLFNVTTLKDERKQGIGKALSLAALICAKESGYRYMALQASKIGYPVYKKLGFKPLPACKRFVKLSTAAWYYKIVELLLGVLSVTRLQQLINNIKKLSKNLLWLMIVMMIIIGLFMVKIFR